MKKLVHASNPRAGRCLVAVLCSLALACGATSELACKPDPTTGSQLCQPTTSSPGNAAVGAGMAAGVYAFTGCTVNGCLLPDRCNPQTKRCEPLPCDEAKPCPAGYSCQLDTKTCR